MVPYINGSREGTYNQHIYILYILNLVNSLALEYIHIIINIFQMEDGKQTDRKTNKYDLPAVRRYVRMLRLVLVLVLSCV